MAERIIKSDYCTELKKRYPSYGMEVVTNRALADVRDGLKPVHRRILYSLQELGLTPDKGYRKCARIVGDVLGKYHPHGDTSVYDALVRLAQDFSMRYMLVDGHGNFGSVDGDDPAAMRYTEAKMNKIAVEILRDINKDTVDFIPNFDGEEKEPTVLPSRYPNLLVNGTSGIAFGMASNIPPHNLKEVIDGICAYIDNSDISIEELVKKHIKAPDFPTGANIFNNEDILNMYKTGKGKITIQSKYHIEEGVEDNKPCNIIVIDEIPYETNKSKMCSTIADEITKSRFYKDVVYVRDESDRHGMRIAIGLKKSSNIKLILNFLMSKSSMRVVCNYNAIFIALQNGIPKLMNLKDMIRYYVDFQKEIITRRSKFDLDKVTKRLHILEGLLVALNNVDDVINIIKTSSNKTDAKIKLKNKYNLTDTQSDTILEMKLRRLTNLEKDDLKIEKASLDKEFKKLNNILSNEKELLKVLKEELIEIKNKYGDDRKTSLVESVSINKPSKEELIEDYNCNISVSREGYIKKYSKQTDNNKVKDGDEIIQEFKCNNKDNLFLFTNKGNRIKFPVNDLDLVTASKSLGSYIPTILSSILPKYDKNEQVVKVISIPQNAKGHILNIYEDGKVSKVNINKYMSANKSLANCYSLKYPIVDIQYINKDCDILLISSDSKGIIFNTSDISPTGTKNSQGITGIKLNENEKVIYSNINLPKNLMITATLDNNKTQDLIFNDIAPTGRPNEQRDVYGYIYGKRARKGYNLFNKNIINVKQIN